MMNTEQLYTKLRSLQRISLVYLANYVTACSKQAHSYFAQTTEGRVIQNLGLGEYDSKEKLVTIPGATRQRVAELAELIVNKQRKG